MKMEAVTQAACSCPTSALEIIGFLTVFLLAALGLVVLIAALVEEL